MSRARRDRLDKRPQAATSGAATITVIVNTTSFARKRDLAIACVACARDCSFQVVGGRKRERERCRGALRETRVTKRRVVFFHDFYDACRFSR